MHLKIFVKGMIHVPEATARELMNLAATENDEQVRSDFYLDAAQKRENDQQKSDLLSEEREHVFAKTAIKLSSNVGRI